MLRVSKRMSTLSNFPVLHTVYRLYRYLPKCCSNTPVAFYPAFRGRPENRVFAACKHCKLEKKLFLPSCYEPITVSKASFYLRSLDFVPRNFSSFLLVNSELSEFSDRPVRDDNNTTTKTEGCAPPLRTEPLLAITALG